MFWISKELMRWSNGDIKYQIGVIKVNNPNISIMYLGAAIVLHFWSWDSNEEDLQPGTVGLLFGAPKIEAEIQILFLQITWTY